MVDRYHHLSSRIEKLNSIFCVLTSSARVSSETRLKTRRTQMIHSEQMFIRVLLKEEEEDADV